VNANIDYLGMLTLLHNLRVVGAFSDKEIEKIAARLAANSGANIVVPR